jgi:hypothetical protein
MIDIKLPVWLNSTNISKLKQAAFLFWQKAEVWVYRLAEQVDANKNELQLLDLIAWERTISRAQDEPLWLYRLRVKHAFINQRESGSRIGLLSIFKRLGIEIVDIQERVDGEDFDVINIMITEGQWSQYQNVLDIIVRKYGRSCRRYRWLTVTNSKINIRAGVMSHESTHLTAKL